MANRYYAIAILAISLAGCGSDPADNQTDIAAAPPGKGARQAPVGTAPAPQAPKSVPASTRPGASEDDAQAAAAVVQNYYALIGAGKYRDAWALRWESDGPGYHDFAASFAPYADYRATVGVPSEVQGAAGSLYVEIPVQLYGQRKDGRPFGSAGTITLRRVNDVPGSTPAQRRWRLYGH